MYDLDLEGLNREFEHADPKSILRWAAETFGDQLAIVTSLQPTGIVVLNMLDELRVRLPVVTLDTDLLFPETYDLIETVEKRFDINIKRIKPEITIAQQNEQYGAALWEREPDVCCHVRKVVPLGKALEGYSAWVTGLRRDQPGRTKTPIISMDKRYQKIKLSPLASWDERMIWTYIYAYELPYNPLHDQGYPSIGCNTTTCTQPVAAGGSSRDGRWVGHANKNECGIHFTGEVPTAAAV